MQQGKSSTEVARFGQFVAVTTLVAFGFGTLEVIASIIFKEMRIGAVGAVTLGYGGCLLVARALLRRGWLTAAVMTSCIGLLAGILLAAPTLPIAIPALTILPLVVVALALPYVRGRTMRLLMIVSGGVGAIVAVLAHVLPPQLDLPAWFTVSFRISSIGTALGLAILLLWQFTSRLNEMLVQTQAINTELQNEIAERKRAEQALHLSQARLNTAVENLPFEFWACDANERYVLQNSRSIQHWGSLIGKTPEEVGVREDILAEWRSNRRRAFAGEVVHTEQAIRVGDETRYTYKTVAPIRDGDQVRGVLGITQDITKLKRAEAVLRESEERTRLIVETALDAHVMIDSGGIITAWNAQAESIFGWPRAEAAGRRLSETIIPAQHREAHEIGLKRFHATGEGPVLNRRIEMTALHRDGHEFPVELTVSPLNTSGSVFFSAFVRDISDRKQTEQRQRAQYSVARVLAESATLVEATPRILQAICESLRWDWGELWSVDREANVLCCVEVWHAPEVELPEFEAATRRAADLYGVGLLGRVWASAQPAWVPDVVADTHFARLSAATTEGLHGAFAFPILFQASVLGVMAFFSHEIREPDVDLLEMFAAIGSQIGQFIERKRAEEAILESAGEAERLAARLRILSEASREFSVATTSFQDLLDLVVRRLSELVGELCVIRLIAEDGEWLEPGPVYHPDPEIVAAAHQVMSALPQRVGEGISGRVAATGQPAFVPVITTAQVAAQTEPKYRPFIERIGISSLLVVPLTSRGRVIGVVSVSRSRPGNPYTPDDQRLVQDLADRAALAIENAALVAVLERRVAKRTAELEAKNRELETFTYSVSHDLKAPLRGIDGYSRLLLEDYAERLDDEGRRFLRNVRTATEQMNQLIDDLLAYSRLERRPLTPGQIDPRALVEALLAERADEMRRRRVNLTLNIACQSVAADREGLAQALRNLIDNALKFTRDMAEPHIDIGGHETENGCILWVRDNGVGFDMQYHERIFEIFQRLHRAEDYTGTGIGLAIVRKALQHMGGRAWAESRLGEGATFYLEIPR